MRRLPRVLTQREAQSLMLGWHRTNKVLAASDRCLPQERNMALVGGRVRVTGERGEAPGGVINLGAPDPDGTWRWVSLGHRNKVRAKQQARESLTRLEGGTGVSTDPKLGYLADLYLGDHVPSMKPKTRAWLTQCLTAWKNYLGPNFRMTHIGPKEWEGFTHLRKTGAIDAYGKWVDVAYRRQ